MTDDRRVACGDILPGEHDLALYRECVRWWEAEGVQRVPVLGGRVLGPDGYERRWLDRCERATERRR